MAKYDAATVARVARIGRALGDPGRVRALLALSDREMCGCHIVSLLGLAPSTVSKHMGVLERAGLVTSRRSGRWRHYRAVGSRAPGEIRKALAGLCRCACATADKEA
ncbi:MAG: metalloregulator ArsR/SmtB family transcription factor [Candidatus Coatesbacteria bacterium]